MLKTFLMNLIIITGCISSHCWAQTYVRPTKKLVMPEKKESTFDVQYFSNKVLPPALASDETSDSLITKIADNSIALYWQESPLRNTSVGRAAETAEKKMKVEVDLKDQNNIDHKFSFKVLALQTLAKIEYSGWVKAAFNYDLRTAATEAEIIESLSGAKDLVLSQSTTNTESNSKISLRWNW